MEGHTLVAVISTTRDDVEYIALNRQDIIDTLDDLKMNLGDCVQISVQFLPDAEVEYSVKMRDVKEPL